MVTLKQVAEAAGVSMKTVSRVINNSPDVAPKTRHHVEHVIAELNYQPNQLARSLASGKTNVVGLLVHHSVEEMFKYPFFNELLGGITACLNQAKLDLLLRFMDKNSSYVELYDQQRVDGLILANAPLHNADLQKLVERQIPCVFLSRIALENNPSHWVDSDFVSGAESITDYLLELGHCHIALMAGSEHLALSHLRIQGYRQAFAKRDYPVTESLIRHSRLFMETAQVRHMLTDYWFQLSPRPTAFIASDDLVAVNLIRELTQLGYRIPEDVSVVGWDNTMLASIATPQVTSVGQQTYKKGFTAASTLLEIMSNATQSPVQIKLDMELIVRDSTGPAPD